MRQGFSAGPRRARYVACPFRGGLFQQNFQRSEDVLGAINRDRSDNAVITTAHLYQRLACSMPRKRSVQRPRLRPLRPADAVAYGRRSSIEFYTRRKSAHSASGIIWIVPNRRLDTRLGIGGSRVPRPWPATHFGYRKPRRPTETPRDATFTRVNGRVERTCVRDGGVEAQCVACSSISLPV